MAKKHSYIKNINFEVAKIATKYSDIPASFISQVRRGLVKEGQTNVVHDNELPVIHRIWFNQLPAEDAVYAILNQREHSDNDDC